MIVFGWNSFKLHAHTPSQLGLPVEWDQEYTIEKRQKYFHLFWIPFFSIGQTWALRKRADNKLYETTSTLEAALNSLVIQHKTPWYTFALFWIALVGGVGFYVQEKVSDYTRERHYETLRKETNEKLTKSIHSPEKGTHYQMVSGGKKVYLKVVKNDPTSLVCLYSTKRNDSYSENEYLEAFVPDSANHPFDTVTIRKQAMLATINREQDYSFKGAELIKGEDNFVMEELKISAFPVFRTISSGYMNGEYFALVQNIGEGGKLKDYSPEATNLELVSPAFPENLKTGEVVELKGLCKEEQPRMRSKVRFESPNKTVAEYELVISGQYLSFVQLDQ